MERSSRLVLWSATLLLLLAMLLLVGWFLAYFAGVVVQLAND